MELMERFDNKRRPLGKVGERYTEEKGEYVQGVHVWIINSKNELLIQKRNPNKKIHPNIWSTTGGGVDLGEITLDAALRECKEELGIDIELNEIELIMSYRRNYDFLDIWLVRKDIDINNVIIQEEEVSEIKWVTFEEFENIIKSNKTSENIKTYFGFFKNLVARIL